MVYETGCQQCPNLKATQGRRGCARPRDAIAELTRVKRTLDHDVELPSYGRVEAVELIMSSRPLPISFFPPHLGPGRDRAAAALAAWGSSRPGQG